MKKVILVLDDTRQRVDWLYSQIDISNVEVIWCKNCEEFLIKSKDKHDLLIMDHDLDEEHYGGYSSSSAPNGAMAAEAYENVFNSPCIIWSVNPEGAIRIDARLTSKGVFCVRVPFLGSNKEKLAALLKTILEEKK